MFELREKYGVATFYSKHEAVNRYITETVQSLHAWFMKDLVEWIGIAVYESQSQKSIARYVFETSVMARNEEDVSATSLGCVDNAFRAHLCRVLSNRGAAGRREGEGAERDGGELSFDYVIGTNGVRTDDAWMPADGAVERRDPGEHALSTPLKDADLSSNTLRVASRLEQ